MSNRWMSSLPHELWAHAKPRRGLFETLVTAWLLIWTFLVLSIDGHGIKQFVLAVRGLSFPSVRGVITASSIESNVDHGQRDRPDRRHLAVSFRYEVGGHTFEKQRWSFWNPTWAGDREQLEQRLKQLPVGQEVDVFYDPADPATAALDRRIEGGPLFLALLLAPFNLVMIGGWVWLRRRRLGLLNRLVHQEEQRWIIRRSLGDPILTATIVAGLLSVVSILLAGLGRWQDNLAAMSVLWSLILTLSFAAMWHAHRTRFFEPPRLICDGESRLVLWPAAEGLEERQSAADWQRTELDDSVTSSSAGEGGEGAESRFVVRLVFRTGTGGDVSRTVLITDNGVEAAALAEWLTDWFRSLNRESAPASPRSDR